MGRDADFSWFRFVIPASKVVRDDFPTGAHEFIPLNPGDSFPTTQTEIYLVFGLVSASFDAVPLTARAVFWKHLEITGEQRAVAQDHVLTSMNDQSGYFMLTLLTLVGQLASTTVGCSRESGRPQIPLWMRSDSVSLRHPGPRNTRHK